MPGSVIVGGARTPIGKLSGALKGFSAMDLGGFAIRGRWQRAGISGDQVDYVIMGHVIQAGAGQITARQAAVKGGIPMSVPALTVNKVCLSGLNAIAMADQLIGYGEFDVVVAGGMESMTNGPYLQPGARAGYRYGDAKLDRRDRPRRPVLRVRPARHGRLHRLLQQGAQASPAPSRTSTRPPSHERATAASKNGAVRRRDRQRRGAAAPRRPAAGHRGRGRPARHHRGEPGQAAPGVRRRRDRDRRLGLQISDGAAAVVVMSPRQGRGARRPDPGRDRRPRHWSPAPTRRCCPSRPTRSTRRWAGRASAPSDVDLFEINEAFASVAIQSMRDLGIGAGQRQRQRRRDRDGPPGRRVRRAASPCTSPSSSAAAAAGSAPPAYAAAAGRARPCSCACPA